MKHPVNAVLIFSLLSASAVAQMDGDAMDHGTHATHGSEAMSAPHDDSSISMPMSHDMASHGEHGVMETAPTGETMHHPPMKQPAGAMPEQHQGHSPVAAVPGSTLTPLDAIPPSGRSREAGFDGRYAMESTDKPDSPASHCGQGSRGLVMLSNAEWRGCGGKVAGASRGITGQSEAVANHSAMNHSAMNH